MTSPADASLVPAWPNIFALAYRASNDYKPDGCWAEVTLGPIMRGPCGEEPVSDLGLCGDHLAAYQAG